jgi:(p)ppGpp synthase/HD superfamily hydrolase
LSNRRPSLRNISHSEAAQNLETYHRYRFEYLDLFKQRALDEYLAIKKEFPNMIFESIYRIKSYDSTIEKGYRVSPNNIYDIHGGKYIIFSVDNRSCEKLLTEYCYKVYQFLIEKYYPSHSIFVIPDRLKDYISKPKANGYQALHLSGEDGYRRFETQIKTKKMEQESKTGTASHATKYKTRYAGRYARTRLPFYLIPIEDKLKHIIIKELSFEETFFHYYGIEYKDYLKKKEYYEKDSNF